MATLVHIKYLENLTTINLLNLIRRPKKKFIGCTEEVFVLG